MTPTWLVRSVLAVTALLGPFGMSALDYVTLLVGYRLLLPIAPPLFGAAGIGDVTTWAWLIALWRLPLHLLELLIFAARPMWRTFRAGQPVESPRPTRLTRFASNAAGPITAFAVSFAILGEPIDDWGRLWALTIVSVVLLSWLSLLNALYKLVLRPVGRAFDKVAGESMAEVRNCKTGHHHPWCGHQEPPG